MTLTLDVGTLATKVAVARAGEESTLSTWVTAARDLRVFLAELIREASPPGHGGPVGFAVPDAWLSGCATGARAQEALRHLAEDELGLTGLTWTGQTAAVAALAAADGAAARGRYLVCDVGGTGVRVGACDVADGTVRTVAVDDGPGAGWQEFDHAIKAALSTSREPAPADRPESLPRLSAGTADDPPAGPPGSGEWFHSAMAQDRRARLVLAQARADPDFLATPAYTFTGTGQGCELTAGDVIGCFAATARRLQAGITTVLGGAQPVAALLTGGLSWFPLVTEVVAEATGVSPRDLGPMAACRGALTLVLGTVRPLVPGLPRVSLARHQIRNGLLEDASLELPWTAPFGDSGGPVMLEGPELILDIGGHSAAVTLPGITPGSYRVGVRTAWRGNGVLVVRADEPRSGPAGGTPADPPGSSDAGCGSTGSTPGVTVPGANSNSVTVHPLDKLEPLHERGS